MHKPRVLREIPLVIDFSLYINPYNPTDLRSKISSCAYI